MSGVLDFDFAVLPPEVNSALMYAGPGSRSLTAAAGAWADLAAELDRAAGVCAGVLSGLTSGDWQGPAAVAMAAAAAPYTSWMRATAGHAARAAGQAAVAANAYENAFAATVPPPEVAGNRAQLGSLIATNVLGQNTAAIAATEAQYAEMWAQDAAAMYGYAAQSAAATALAPLASPPTVTTDTGPAQQTAATTHAATAAAGNGQTALSQLLSTLPGTLNALATGSASAGGSTSSSLSALWNALGLNIFATGSGTSSTGLAGLINLISGSDANPVSNLLDTGWVANGIFAGYGLNPEIITEAVGDLGALGMVTGRSLSHLSAASAVGFGAVSGADNLAPIASQPSSFNPPLGGLGTLVGERAIAGEVTASAGKAALVGGLSTPRTWATAAPAGAIRLAAAVSNPPASTPGIGIGPMGMPGMPMSGAVSGRSDSGPHYCPAPRYGFRLKVMPSAPTGNVALSKQGISQ